MCSQNFDKLGHSIVKIQLPAHSYNIYIGHGLLQQSQKKFEGIAGESALIVTNTKVSPLYAQQLTTFLSKIYQRIEIVQLPDGEAYKTWETLNEIFDKLLSSGFDRKATLFALGGGVVGDMTGFAAACFMRGVHFVQIPTTLLAQVDSSIGGKTAINHPLGKNMIGAFYQPQVVICDLQTLTTLPQREISAGLAEIIKHAAICDLEFFEWLEQSMDSILKLEPKAIHDAVKRSCEIKAQIVMQDEKEMGVRAHLNLGHTFGHAIEAGLGYGLWLHGEAVGAGMVLAAHLSQQLGYIDETWVQRVIKLIARAGLPTHAPKLLPEENQAANAQRYLDLMRLDKKAHAGNIRYVLLKKVGLASIESVSDEKITNLLERMVV